MNEKRQRILAIGIAAMLILVVVMLLYIQAISQSTKNVQLQGINDSDIDVYATIWVNSTDDVGSITIPAHGSHNITIGLHLQDRVNVTVSNGSVHFEGSNEVRKTTDSISISVYYDGSVYVFLSDGLGLPMPYQEWEILVAIGGLAVAVIISAVFIIRRRSKK